MKITKHIIRYVISVTAAAYFSAAYAKGAAVSPSLTIGSTTTRWVLTADQITMPPQGQITGQYAGLLGLSYLVDLRDHFYAGLTGQAFVTGGHGGFFIYGVNGGVHLPLTTHLFTEAGSFLGAGGAYDSLVGGGLAIQPYADIGLDFHGWQIAARLNYLTTPSAGHIHTTQVGLLVAMPSHFYYAEAAPWHGAADTQQDSDYYFLPVYVGLGYSYYNITGLSARDIQQVLTELGYYFSSRWFADVQFAGAFYSGTASNGYMEGFVGLGFRQPFTPHLAFVAHALAGAAGGGGANTKDGGMVKATAGAQWLFAHDWGIEMDGGILRSLSTNTQGAVLSAEALYRFGYPHQSDFPAVPGSLTEHYWRLQVYNQSFFNPKHVTPGTYTPTVQLLGLQFNLNLARHVYAAAQTAAAYYGHSGGFATVLIGGGVHTTANNDPGWGVGAEFLLGAGGAGAMAVGDTLLLNPLADVYYNSQGHWGIFAGAGQLFGLKNGTLSTPVLNAGMVWRFATVSD